MKKEWQRPQTTRRYVHPPKAERMFTLWKEGKIIFGEINEPIRANCYEIVSHGVWFTHGDGESADFHTAENKIREDGIPVHGLKNAFGGLSVELETFTSFERRPTCYIKATVKNVSEKAQKFGAYIRTATEGELVHGFPDVYEPYSPDIEVWKALPSTFSYDTKVLRDGEYYLTAPDMDYDAARGHISVTLASGEEKTLIFSFGKGEAADFDYTDEMAKNVAAWELELKKITKLPEGIKANDEYVKTIKNLTVQMLQCFCTSVESNNLYPRQGGLQRQIWTGEAWMVIEALTRIGDFRDYTAPVLELYYDTFQKEDGEMVPFGISWAMATATVIYTFAKCAMGAGKALWDKYSEQTFKSFKWIMQKRVPEAYTDEKGNPILGGLFPPLRSCDDELVFQAWSGTDIHNLIGIKAYLDAAEYFGDAHTKEIREGYEDYLETLRGYWRSVVKSADNSEDIEVPISLTIPPEVMFEKYEFCILAGQIFATGVAGCKEFDRVMKNYEKHGRRHGGLYWRMKDKRSNGAAKYNLNEDGKSVVWYVCNDEFWWFKHFMNVNDRERAEEIIRDNFKFAMTDEYYMVERYNQCDPYFGPWMPNASANGRTVNMLLDFYG